jgi:hypothetical protein
MQQLVMFVVKLRRLLVTHVTHCYKLELPSER